MKGVIFMAASSTPLTGVLVLNYAEMGEDGKSKIKKIRFINVKPATSDDDLFAVGSVIESLIDHDIVDFQKEISHQIQG
jgi:hypothetical protein